MELPSAKSITSTPFINITYVRVARVKVYRISNGTGSQLEQSWDLREDEHSLKTIQPTELTGGLGPDTNVVNIQNNGLGGLGSGRRDPFMSFVRPFTGMEHFLLDQYITAVSPYLLHHCSGFRVPGSGFDDSMIGEWIRLSLSDVGFLNGIFLTASRYLSIFHQPYQPNQHRLLTKHATQYKLVCLRTLNEAISSSTGKWSFSDSIIAETMVLAMDEISLGDLETSRRHMQGAFKMIELNGGPQTLGLNGFLEMVFHKFTEQVGLPSKF
ncbi:hypothetical protein V8C35DRAFT_318676, partial [Trichoderma chlorosporum]